MGTHPIFESDFDCLTEVESCERSFICKLVNAVTKLVPNSGRLSLKNMALIRTEFIQVRRVCSSTEFPFITTKRETTNMCRALSSSISNPELWMQSEAVNLATFSVLTILYLVNQVLGTTGPKVTTLKVPS